MVNYTNTTCANNTAEAEATAVETAAISRCKERDFCLNIVLGFLSILLAFTLGLIVGALLSLFVLIALPAIIVFAIVLAVLIISLLIFRWCRKDKKDHCRCCCR